MELDIDKTIGMVNNGGDVEQKLRKLQSCLRHRDDAQVWARNLRFITPSAIYPAVQPPREDNSSDNTEDACSCWSANLFESQDNVLEVTPASQYQDCNHYVAVSWVWQSDQPPRSAVAAPERYFIASEAILRDCFIPRHVLSRAISYAAHHNVPFIWFDQECIQQEDPVDKELGIQSMDIVYQRSLHPLGILQIFIQTQDHLDLFSQLVEGVDIPSDELPILLEVLQLIERDKWFTRAWILQESTSGGFEMNLLIQHEPNLQKPNFLGEIAGEIEITIMELIDAIYFASACVSLCEDEIDADLESQLYQAIEHILSFLPTVVQRPEKGFGDPDHRQTCNAAQALTYLRPRMNHRIADRIAIMGNLCDYGLRLDTTEIEGLGYGFSICAFALALFNGDLSLTRSDNPVDGDFLAYSWGPQHGLKLSELDHFEDDDLVVRAGPAKLVQNGLLVKGWLWQVTDFLPLNPTTTELQSTNNQPDQASLIWSLITHLLTHNLVALAQLVWSFTRKSFFGTNRDVVHNSPAIPADLHDILDFNTRQITFYDEKWMRSKTDFRAFFESTTNTTTTPQDKENQKRWGYSRWSWTLLHTGGGSVPLAKLVRKSASLDDEFPHYSAVPAIFDLSPPAPATGASKSTTPRYIFQPSSTLDANLSRTQRRNRPMFWLVELETNADQETGCRIVRGTGRMCRGYYRVLEGVEPEVFVWQ